MHAKFINELNTFKNKTEEMYLDFFFLTLSFSELFWPKAGDGKEVEAYGRAQGKLTSH